MATAHTATALIKELETAGIPYKTVPHKRTATALAEAKALHVEPAAVAKTVVLSTPKGMVRAVIPASARLDVAKVRDALNVTRADLLTETALAGAYPEFEVGAVPPIGGPHGDSVIVDIGICERRFVLFDAGRHDASIRIATEDLTGHESVAIADICAA